MKKNNLLYATTDEWVDPETGEVGISAYATSHLGDIVFIDVVKKIGDNIEQGEVFGAIESVKSASDLYSPVAGKIVAINQNLLDKPETVSDYPWDTWFIKIEPTTVLPIKVPLLTVEEYENSRN